MRLRSRRAGRLWPAGPDGRRRQRVPERSDPVGGPKGAVRENCRLPGRGVWQAEAAPDFPAGPFPQGRWLRSALREGASVLVGRIGTPRVGPPSWRAEPRRDVAGWQRPARISGAKGKLFRFGGRKSDGRQGTGLTAGRARQGADCHAGCRFSPWGCGTKTTVWPAARRFHVPGAALAPGGT